MGCPMPVRPPPTHTSISMIVFHMPRLASHAQFSAFICSRRKPLGVFTGQTPFLLPNKQCQGNEEYRYRKQKTNEDRYMLRSGLNKLLIQDYTFLLWHLSIISIVF